MARLSTTTTAASGGELGARATGRDGHTMLADSPEDELGRIDAVDRRRENKADGRSRGHRRTRPTPRQKPCRTRAGQELAVLNARRKGVGWQKEGRELGVLCAWCCGGAMPEAMRERLGDTGTAQLGSDRRQGRNEPRRVRRAAFGRTEETQRGTRPMSSASCRFVDELTDDRVAAGRTVGPAGGERRPPDVATESPPAPQRN